ncbi:hypothetical protein BN7_1256 [Wickerhamomyces ciferrii]|uniref:Uncharacterized protein n=1 Tax=Wickerhamomyces ciferrii (strain ATCC 14091 / BCRC 22168 / CBS 111 / JCM 3599 / NBRC 0793 / NRRL Y-1031 F-60-10) TaxID=1206466 RepID=K0K9V8_WICCF|nr:uncharacterized protein BN7_1256 [Wickerhamomyces ciferrii]CCH41715.1 hypothetical protein BN7_1256 [Wickerhamomyces ciferrii]
MNEINKLNNLKNANDIKVENEKLENLISNLEFGNNIITVETLDEEFPTKKRKLNEINAKPKDPMRIRNIDGTLSLSLDRINEQI